MNSLQQALEAALTANPDDTVAHMAYGDYLAEQGDPRGEFVQVQLALENARLPPAERQRLAAREAELLAAHRNEWLGPLAPYFPVSERADNVATFRRGWIDAVRVHTLTSGVARVLARAERLRLMRSLTLVSAATLEDPPADDGESNLGVWSMAFHAGASHLGNVRSLSLGDVEGDAGFQSFPPGADLRRLVQALPRLEELHVNAIDPEGILTAVRPGLLVLRLERARLGDAGLRTLAFSGLLNGLKVLQIWNARFTDVGARALARSPALKNLDLLDVSFNWLTPAGIGALRKACPNVVAEYQMTQADDVDDEYAGDPFEPTLE